MHFFFERDERVGQRGQHPRRHTVFAGEFDRADLQDLGAQRGHLEHFLERHDRHAARFGHDARVGRVDAVDVGVDQAFIGLDRRRHGHGRGIGTAAAQRGDVAVGVHALEARHDDHAAGVKVGADARVVDRGDAGLGVGRVGAHGHLPAGVAARGHAFGLQRDGQQAAAGLLAGGGDHVELAAVRHGRNLARQAQQAIGLARHGRRHHDNLVACGVPLRDATRHIPDALDRAHRSTAIFVNDEGHLVLWLGTRPKYVDGQNLIF